MILVAGGTGRLGTLVVHRLAARGFDVRVLTREPSRAADLPQLTDTVAGDVRDPVAVRRAVAGCALVVSLVHGFIGGRGVSPATVDRDGNAHLVDAAKAAGAELVLMSIVGASPDSPMELFRMKHAAEEYATASGVPVTIVRATAFMELWIDLLRQTAARSGRPLVFGRGDNPVNFVSVGDVAALVEHACVDPATRGLTLEIGGPDDLTFNDLARAVQRADGGSGAPRHVPTAMLRLASTTAGRLKPHVGRQTRAALAMDRVDLRFDAAAIHRRYPDIPSTTLSDVLRARLGA